MSEPKREKNLYDDTDRHLMAALHSVKIPRDLRSRLERAIQIASQEHELVDVPVTAEQSSVQGRPNSVFWNRRSAIAAVLAAGVGGLALGVQQFYQPLSQSQLVVYTQTLLDQVERNNWQTLTNADTVEIKRWLQDVGFLQQVRNVTLVGVRRLKPPSNIREATAYVLDSKSVLFDLVIDRGVQRLSHALTELQWSRSGIAAFAMSSQNRTLVFAGPAGSTGIRKHISPPQTI